MRRVFFWTAVLAALAAVGAGGGYAYVSYRATSAPGAVLKAYFAALGRADAPAALALGDVPAGTHQLLTSPVLAEQQHLAALHDVHVVQTVTTGSSATVRYTYRLRFADRDQPVAGSAVLTRHGARWRLANSAVSVSVLLDQAADRVTLAGTSVPNGAVLLFPGALPLQFDSPYLQPSAATSAIGLGGPSTIDVGVQVTSAARAELLAALSRQLNRCVAKAPAASDCPLPAGVVPGSLNGHLAGALADTISVEVGSDAAGPIDLTGTVSFTGRYRRLDFDNVVHSRDGRLALSVAATAYPVAPLTVHFTDFQ